jgi:uncharacterized phage-associated protein
MANIFDVAQYILNKLGKMTTWKLQKLCYYAQAWSLVWDDAPLFDERIEAWANGPVIPALYEKHKGRFYITTIKGDPKKLNQTQSETVDIIIESYGKKTSNWLSEQTHNEAPWRNARNREHLACGERGSAIIRLDEMAEYYGGLNGEQAEQV